ncbi:MAG: cbb3-type cytochrome oxidase subunit 3 [Vibrio sp.]
MDIITVHSLWTVLIFVSFCGVVWWAYGKKRKSQFEEAANLIFDDEPTDSNKDQGGMK